MRYKSYAPPTKQLARQRYADGGTVLDISRDLGIPAQTVYSWIRRGNWGRNDAQPAADLVAREIAARMAAIVCAEDKKDKDYRELDELGKTLERMSRVEKHAKTGRESDLNPKIAARAEGRKKAKEANNTLTPDQIADLGAAFRRMLYPHQQIWLDNTRHRCRIILKSRQIGATYYIAQERLVHALETGDNQIFLSASRRQALIFRRLIVDCVRAVTGVTLKGDPLHFPHNDARIHFLATNANTSQGESGHVVNDEFAWTPKFDVFQQVTSAMASQSRYTMTYLSTPSAEGCPAHKFWLGTDKGLDLDITSPGLHEGIVCDDGVWRQIVTVDDVIARGFDLLDLDQLRQENSPEAFERLYRCKWASNEDSWFSFVDLQKCAVDMATDWLDVDLQQRRPYTGPVAIGYDPAIRRDTSAAVVVALPTTGHDYYRVLDAIQLAKGDFIAQADAIHDLARRYNVTSVNIDATTIGTGVADILDRRLPGLMRRITYTHETKWRMASKAQALISRRRLRYDAATPGLVASFLSIRPRPTGQGGNVTLGSARDNDTGHADLAWATMQAVDADGAMGTITGQDGDTRMSTVDFI